MYACVYVCMCARLCVCACARAHMCVHACVFVCVCACACMCVNVCVCVCVCVCVLQAITRNTVVRSLRYFSHGQQLFSDLPSPPPHPHSPTQPSTKKQLCRRFSYAPRVQLFHYEIRDARLLFQKEPAQKPFAILFLDINNSVTVLMAKE